MTHATIGSRPTSWVTSLLIFPEAAPVISISASLLSCEVNGHFMYEVRQADKQADKEAGKQVDTYIDLTRSPETEYCGVFHDDNCHYPK